MPSLTRDGPRLLRIVDGKPHASSEDHEMTEEEIHAAPMSSDDDTQISRSPDRQPSKPSTPSRTTNTCQTSTRRNKERRSFRPPARGAYANGIADKARKGFVDEEKENGGASSQSSAGNGESRRSDEGIEFGFEYSAPKRQRLNTFRTKTTNIHARPTNGEKKASGSGTSMRKTSTKKPAVFVKNKQQPEPTEDKSRPVKAPSPKVKNNLEEDDDGSDSSVSLMSVTVPSPKNKTRSKDVKAIAPEPPPKPVRPSLIEQLGAYRQDQTPGTPQPSLPNLDPLTSGDSTPLSSINSATLDARGESLQTLEKYFADLPAAPDDDQCPLCEEPVEQEHYWAFWKGKKMSVRHQSQFCKEHKKREALQEYKKKGYPQVDWDTFPEKIKQYHPHLIAVLRNTTDKPNPYRELHAERMAAREERTVRNLLDSGTLLESTTGYYGSRGKRAMMEAITLDLGDVIRDCVKRDKVVAFNGFANFVQAVLVPELTVRMVMDELDVGEEVAKLVVEESGQLGLVVNEEVEDRVVLESDSSDEDD